MHRAAVSCEDATRDPDVLGALAARQTSTHPSWCSTSCTTQVWCASSAGFDGLAVPFNVARRRDDNARSNPDPARDNRRIRDLAHPHGEIESVLDHVAKGVAHHQFDLEPGWVASRAGSRGARK